MGVLDVFDADAFSFASLTKAVNQMSHVPTMLSTMPGLFEDVPVRTKVVWIERQGDSPALIQSTARGTPPAQVGGDKRDARAFNTFRLANASRISADELLGIRRSGSEVDVKDLAAETGRRMFKLTSRHDMTMEFHRFNVVALGKTLDADGTTIYDWTNEFASPPSGGRTLTALSETAFNFAAGTLGSVRKNCNAIVRGIKRNLTQATMVGGSDAIINADGMTVTALCGDSFYDQLTMHPEVRSTYLNWPAAAALRRSVGEVWMPFEYGGIEWLNYRGTDDNTGPAADTTGRYSSASFGVGTNHAAFFPRNAGIFQMAYAPGEKFEYLGTPGQQRYAMIVRDLYRDMWADIEVYTYPLPVCVLPQALTTGRAGT